MDVSCVLHPLCVHKLDAGPVRLVTIAQAFNYRMAVLRDGVKSAIRVRRSRKGIAALRGVSPNVQLYSEPWGHVDHSNVN